MIQTYYESKSTDKRIQENSGVNVIYFTNKCNLACTYCYEDLKDRPAQILTKEQIMNSVDIILEREKPEEQTLFVLFGGEVTLEWENAKFMMDYAYSKKKNVHFNISTNGIKFKDVEFIKEYKKLKYNLLNLTSIDISFDGIGNSERITHSGKDTTLQMLDIFKKLNAYKVDFRLRYTIHNLNINFLYQDLKSILEKIKPKRLITSVAWSKLSQNEIDQLQEVKNVLRSEWQNNLITIPVCEMFCDMCNGCSVQKELKTYFSDEGNINTLKNNENAKVFGDFKQKKD
jgi:sulfatase maturation enzyme AslB (radical SAM superfamily)